MSFAAEAVYEVLDERTRDLLERRAGIGAGHRRGWLVRRALLVADLVGLTLAFAVAHEIYVSHDGRAGTLTGLGEVIFFVASLPMWVVAAKIYGLYDKDEERTDHSTTDDFAGVFHLVTVCTFLLYAISLQTRWFDPKFDKLLLFWLLACISVTSARAIARAYCRRQIAYLQNTIVVGAGEVGQNVARKLLKHPEYGINVVGFIDSNPMKRGNDLKHLTILGGHEDLAGISKLLDVDRIIYAFSEENHEDVLASIRSLGDLDVQVDIIPRLFDALGPSASIHTLEGLPVIGLPPLRLTRSSFFLKRATDIGLATLALALAAPVMAGIACAVWAMDGRPVFFRSERVGRRRRTFRALKFRTMSASDGSGVNALAEVLSDPIKFAEFSRTHKLEHDPRITRLGRFLRAWSLDELPQLWNILRGDISIVGPRPITSDEFSMLDGARVDDGYWSLSDLRPGLTGYWQINGRSNMDYAERLRLDSAYLKGWSLGLDLAIIAKTFRVLLSRSGAR